MAKMQENVKITTEYITLAAFLKFAGVAGTGGEAKMLIQDGLVSVNGSLCVQRGKKLRAGDRISFEDITYLVRGGIA